MPRAVFGQHRSAGNHYSSERPVRADNSRTSRGEICPVTGNLARSFELLDRALGLRTHGAIGPDLPKAEFGECPLHRQHSLCGGCDQFADRIVSFLQPPMAAPSPEPYRRADAAARRLPASAPRSRPALVSAPLTGSAGPVTSWPTTRIDFGADAGAAGLAANNGAGCWPFCRKAALATIADAAAAATRIAMPSLRHANANDVAVAVPGRRRSHPLCF